MRELAVDLMTINPNTIAKAYQELERAGVPLPHNEWRRILESHCHSFIRLLIRTTPTTVASDATSSTIATITSGRKTSATIVSAKNIIPERTNKRADH